MVSGDGEYVRHAVTNEDGFQLARAWVDGNGSIGCWAAGFVNTSASEPGVFAGHVRQTDYQVLTAGGPCSRSWH